MNELRTPTREAQLRALAELASPTLVPERAEILLLDLEAGVTPGDAVELAGRSGLLPLVALRLTALPSGLAPPAWLDAFRPWRRHYVARSLLTLRALGGVLRVLRAAGIEAINLKGPFLARAAMGDAAARSFEDLDLLVHPDEVPAAMEALERAGWAPHPDIPLAMLDDVRRLGCEVPFLRDGMPVVDLHWDLFPAYFVTDGLRGGLHSEVVESLAGPLRGLDANGRLLHAALHGAMDRWPDLGHVADVAWTARDATIDWEPFTRVVVRAGLGRVLGVNLALAHDLFGTPVPDVARPIVARHSRANGVAEDVARRLLAGAAPVSRAADAALEHARLRERMADRWRVVARHAFTPRPGEWNRPAGVRALFGGLRFLRDGSRALRDGASG